MDEIVSSKTIEKYKIDTMTARKSDVQDPMANMANNLTAEQLISLTRHPINLILQNWRNIKAEAAMKHKQKELKRMPKKILSTKAHKDKLTKHKQDVQKERKIQHLSEFKRGREKKPKTLSRTEPTQMEMAKSKLISLEMDLPTRGKQETLIQETQLKPKEDAAQLPTLNLPAAERDKTLDDLPSTEQIWQLFKDFEAGGEAVWPVNCRMEQAGSEEQPKPPRRQNVAASEQTVDAEQQLADAVASISGIEMNWEPRDPEPEESLKDEAQKEVSASATNRTDDRPEQLKLGSFYKSQGLSSAQIYGTRYSQYAAMCATESGSKQLQELLRTQIRGKVKQQLQNKFKGQKPVFDDNAEASTSMLSRPEFGIRFERLAAYSRIDLYHHIDLAKFNANCPDSSVYDAEVRVLKFCYEDEQDAWLWENGVCFMPHANPATIAQFKDIAKILGCKVEPYIGHSHMARVIQFPWTIALDNFCELYGLTAPVVKKGVKYANYVHKDLQGVLAKVFETGLVQVFSMNPGESTRMLKIVELITNPLKHKNPTFSSLNNE